MLLARYQRRVILHSISNCRINISISDPSLLASHAVQQNIKQQIQNRFKENRITLSTYHRITSTLTPHLHMWLVELRLASPTSCGIDRVFQTQFFVSISFYYILSYFCVSAQFLSHCGTPRPILSSKHRQWYSGRPWRYRLPMEILRWLVRNALVTPTVACFQMARVV